MKIKIHSWKENGSVIEQLDIDGNAEFTIASPEGPDSDCPLISCSDILGFIQKAHREGINNLPLEVSYNNQISP